MTSWRAGALEVLELGVELVVGVLGQPDRALLGGLRHGYSCGRWVRRGVPAGACRRAGCSWCAWRRSPRAAGRATSRGARAWTALRDSQTIEFNNSAGSRRSARAWSSPGGGAADQLDRGRPALGADGLAQRLRGRRRRGEGELADHRVVLGVGPQQAARPHAVVARAVTSTRAVACARRRPRSRPVEDSTCGVDCSQTPSPASRGRRGQRRALTATSARRRQGAGAP